MRIASYAVPGVKNLGKNRNCIWLLIRFNADSLKLTNIRIFVHLETDSRVKFRIFVSALEIIGHHNLFRTRWSIIFIHSSTCIYFLNIF